MIELIIISVFSMIVVGSSAGLLAARIAKRTQYSRRKIVVIAGLLSFGFFYLLAVADLVVSIPLVLLIFIMLPWAVGFGSGNLAAFIALTIEGFISWLIAVVIVKLRCSRLKDQAREESA